MLEQIRFYSKNECCHCYNIANTQRDTLYDFGYCYAKYKHNICDDIDPNDIHYDSDIFNIYGTFLFIKFPNNYIYYAIVMISVVLIYLCFILYELALIHRGNGQTLFNMVTYNIIITILGLYDLIKLYQFQKSPIDMDTSNQCYVRTISKRLYTILLYFTTFATIYITIPFIRCICSNTLCRRKYQPCIRTFYYVRMLLMLLAFIFAICFIILLVIACYILIRDIDKFNIIEYISETLEYIFAIIVISVLCFNVLDVFLLKQCRYSTKLLLQSCFVNDLKHYKSNTNNEFSQNTNESSLIPAD